MIYNSMNSNIIFIERFCKIIPLLRKQIYRNEYLLLSIQIFLLQLSFYYRVKNLLIYSYNFYFIFEIIKIF